MLDIYFSVPVLVSIQAKGFHSWFKFCQLHVSGSDRPNRCPILLSLNKKSLQQHVTCVSYHILIWIDKIASVFWTWCGENSQTLLRNHSVFFLLGVVEEKLYFCQMLSTTHFNGLGLLVSSVKCYTNVLASFMSKWRNSPDSPGKMGNF